MKKIRFVYIDTCSLKTLRCMNIAPLMHVVALLVFYLSSTGDSVPFPTALDMYVELRYCDIGC